MMLSQSQSQHGSLVLVTRCVHTVMGKAEGSVAREEWHGHVTALSVAPEFRRLGLAAKLMDMLEEISERFRFTFTDRRFSSRESNRICLFVPQEGRLLRGPVCARVQPGGG